ncbi:1,4-dihydroxy-6-naphthoate synthase [Nannocystaceae bacterium ST9]
MHELALGFSSCPNDTFMFHALVFGLTEVPGVRFAPVIEDIEALNQRALDPARRLPITKLSAAAIARLTEHYTVLDAGAALGRGCGPLVVRRAERDELRSLGDLEGRRVAIPGEQTTAYLLLRIACEAARFEAVALRFDEIMPAVARGQVDAGLIIHESRFTYPQHGLVELADLGVIWEARTGMPIPLGMIAVERSLGEPTIAAIEQGLRRSVELAFEQPERSRAWIREHAQELDDEVCRRHIALYVNEFSRSLAREGRAAIDELLARGRASGLLPAARDPWR